MSLNSLTDKSYTHSVEAFKSLFQMMATPSTSRSVEEKLSLEWKVVNTFKELISFDTLQINTIRPTDSLDEDEFNYPRKMFSYILLMNNVRTQSISNTYLKYFNNQKTDLLEIYGKITLNNKNKATLDLWSGSSDKFILSEHFFNLDNIGNKYINSAMCSIDTVAGCLTLPIVSTKTISPQKVTLGSKSNGLLGSSDIDVNTSNSNPSFLFDGNQETWLQYEGAAGPLSLVLVCELSSTEILNEVNIEPVNLGASINYSVKNITFSSSDKEVTTLKEMVSGEVPEDYFTVNSSENDSYWSCKFLPVRCQQVIIHLEQSNNSSTDGYSPEGYGVKKNKYSIGVRSIVFKRNEYSSIGAINSKSLSLNEGLYAATVTSKLFPRKALLYDIYSDVSFDDGEQWEMDAYSLPEVNNKTILMDGMAESALWRLRLERNDKAFADARSLTDEEISFDIESKQRMASKFISPIRVNLDERPFNKEVYVIQPKVGRRTNSRKKSIRLASGKSGIVSRFPLGFSLKEMGLEREELHVYVNGIEWSMVDDSGGGELSPSAGSGEFHLNEAEDALIFSSDLADRAVITFRFDEERVLWQEASDGYYTQLSAPFDPDPMNIEISGRPSSGKKVSKVLQKGKNRIYLGVTDLLYENGGNQIDFVSDTSVFTSKASISEVNSGVPAANEHFYYLDPNNGVLHINPVIDSSSVKLSFKHMQASQTKKDKIKVITNGIKPTGIRVEKDSLQLLDYADASGSERDERFNPQTKSFGRRSVAISDPTSGNKTTVLTHDYIVKGTVSLDASILSGYSAGDFPMVEVDYVDGITEFLGLLQMENEATVSIQADSSGIVKFRLAAGSSIYEPFKISFDDESVFNSSKEEESLSAIETLGPSNIGAYYIDYNQGVVYVTVGSGMELKSGIRISYSYQDLNFDKDNLYSIDYKGGILYTYRIQRNSSEKNIRYKTSLHTVAYDLSKEIDLYKYNVSRNVVSIRTEGMSKINNLVKVVWAKAKIKPSVAEFRKYFSPIIDTFGIRFQ